MKPKTYTINKKTYHAKERYSLKVWAQIIELLRQLPVQEQSTELQVLAILGSDTLPELLSLILDNPIDGELYDDDFEDIQRVINDFFSRKKSLMSVSVNQ